MCNNGNVIGVGLIGCGTVGSGVVKLLVEEAELYAKRLGRRIEIRAVLVREEDKGYMTEQVPDGRLIHDVDGFFDTPDMDVVIELAGGKGAALEFVRRALQDGKHVVTANKALLAEHGGELLGLARENGVAVAFEASCGGGIPIITAMQFNLISNEITAMYGILNGTCNYILTQMAEYGKDYDVALGEAQEAGFAEADPTLDVNGGDTRHKLAVLGGLAFGVNVTDEQILCEGIDDVELMDIRFGGELGYEMKLLAIGEQSDDGLSLCVGPCFVHRNELLAQVSGSFNALSIYGHAVGHTMYYGRGAGQMPTASAVVGDLMSIVSGAYTSAFANLTMWSDQQGTAELADASGQLSRYYIRLNALDRPNVLAKISAVLGKLSISIGSVLQHEVAAGSYVPVVITTHNATVGSVKLAASELEKLDIINGKVICIRIVDMPEG